MISGQRIQVQRAPGQAGDVRHTYADIARAQRDMGYSPQVDLDEGLHDEVAWFEHVHLKKVQG